MTDQDLLQLFLHRSEGAIAAAKEQYGRLLLQLCRNILGDARDAEECVSDTLLALWNTIPPQAPQNLTAYACRIAKNRALKRLRHDTAQKRDNRALLALEELGDCLGSYDLQSALDARQLGLSINGWLQGQSDRDRLLFLRRYWFGDSVADAAALAGLGQNAAAQRLRRLREKLRTYLEQEGFDL